jgi:hypothetical protein
MGTLNVLRLRLSESLAKPRIWPKSRPVGQLTVLSALDFGTILAIFMPENVDWRYKISFCGKLIPTP